jgi:hypothetical protein
MRIVALAIKNNRNVCFRTKGDQRRETPVITGKSFLGFDSLIGTWLNRAVQHWHGTQCQQGLNTAWMGPVLIFISLPFRFI